MEEDYVDLSLKELYAGYMSTSLACQLAGGAVGKPKGILQGDDITEGCKSVFGEWVDRDVRHGANFPETWVYPRPSIEKVQLVICPYWALGRKMILGKWA